MGPMYIETPYMIIYIKTLYIIMYIKTPYTWNHLAVGKQMINIK